MSVKPTYELFRDALAKRAIKRAHDESEKLPALRAGNSGADFGDGKYVGSCKRRGLLRYLSVDASDADDARQLMFEAGLANEDIWVNVLRDAGVPAENIRCEEEIPTRWITAGGIPVTGRPDVVVGEMESGVWRPKKLYELKLASSLWTGKEVLVEGRPKDAHVVQAAHYFWQTNAESAELLYLSRSDYAIGPSYHGMFKGLDKRPELAGYFELGDNGFIKKMTPFLVSYELVWHTDGTLLYRQVLMDGTTSDYVTTKITRDGIRSFYESIGSDYSLGKLSARPSGVKIDGSKASYKECQYCMLKQVCDKSEKHGLEPWLVDVKSWLGQADTVKELETTHAIKKR